MIYKLEVTYDALCMSNIRINQLDVSYTRSTHVSRNDKRSFCSFFCDYIYSLSLKFIKLHNRQPGNTDIELIATFHKEGRLGPIKLSHS